jgi:hypothetical protein
MSRSPWVLDSVVGALAVELAASLMAEALTTAGVLFYQINVEFTLIIWLFKINLAIPEFGWSENIQIVHIHYASRFDNDAKPLISCVL